MWTVGLLLSEGESHLSAGISMSRAAIVLSATWLVPEVLRRLALTSKPRLIRTLVLATGPHLLTQRHCTKAHWSTMRKRESHTYPSVWLLWHCCIPSSWVSLFGSSSTPTNYSLLFIAAHASQPTLAANRH